MNGPPPSNGKLTVSIGEALASKSSESTLLSRPTAEPARPSPPSSRPSRMPVYPREAPTQLHALPPPSGPDRSLVASEETKRERKRRTVLPPAERAAAVQRVLAGETAVRVANDFGVSAAGISRMVREAKESAARETSKKFEANDIQKVSTELAEALNLQRAATERVKVLKAKLRVLLGDE